MLKMNPKDTAYLFRCVLRAKYRCEGEGCFILAGPKYLQWIRENFINNIDTKTLINITPEEKEQYYKNAPTGAVAKIEGVWIVEDKSLPMGGVGV